MGPAGGESGWSGSARRDRCRRAVAAFRAVAAPGAVAALRRCQQQGGPGQDHQFHRPAQVIGVQLVAALQGGVARATRRANRSARWPSTRRGSPPPPGNGSPVDPPAPSCSRFRARATRWRSSSMPGPNRCQNRSGSACRCSTRHRLHPLLQLQLRIGAEGDGEAIHQVGSQLPLGRVVGGDQQGAAGVLEADPLPLHPVDPLGQGGEQQVADAGLQQVDLIDAQHAPVGLRQQPRQEHGVPRPDRASHIHRPQQPVLAHAQGHLHGRGRDHPAHGNAVDGGPAGPGPVVPIAGGGGIGLAAGADDGPGSGAAGRGGRGPAPIWPCPAVRRSPRRPGPDPPPAAAGPS
jgi:hypothetical protein